MDIYTCEYIIILVLHLWAAELRRGTETDVNVEQPL